jgi:hypothetical protein
MNSREIPVPYDWRWRWPDTAGTWGQVITLTYDGRGGTVDIEGDWDGLTSDELGALEDETLYIDGYTV